MNCGSHKVDNLIDKCGKILLNEHRLSNRTQNNQHNNIVWVTILLKFKWKLPGVSKKF